MSDAAPHVSVLLSEVLDNLSTGPGETVVDGTFGAGGYTRAILATGAKVVAFDRDPTVRRFAAGLADRPLPAGGGALLGDGRGAGRGLGRRRGAGPRRVVHADRRGRARLLVHARRSAGHADGRRRAHRRRSGQHRRPGGAGADHLRLWRGAREPPDRPRHRPPPRRAAVHPHPGAGRLRRARPGRPPRRQDPSRHPHLPGPADRGERGAARSWKPASWPPSGC